MVLFKTALGQAAFKQRSSDISARQRSMFIMVNGSKTVDQILAATVGLGITRADVDHLLQLGYLSTEDQGQPADTGAAPLEAPSALAASAPAPLESVSVSSEFSALPPRSEQERYMEAKPLATQLTASLGLRGFMLNLSVESAAGYQDLLKLLPKIQAAVGSKASRQLTRVLLG